MGELNISLIYTIIPVIKKPHQWNYPPVPYKNIWEEVILREENVFPCHLSALYEFYIVLH